MNSNFGRSALLFGVFVVAAISQAEVVLNFDEKNGAEYFAGSTVFSDSQISDDYLAAYGAQFSSGAGYAAVVNLGTEFSPSGSNALAGTTSEGLVSYSSLNPITISFWNPNDPNQAAGTDFFSLATDLSGLPGQMLTLNAYDVNGGLIGTTTVEDTGGAVLSLSFDSPLIHSVTFLGSPTDDNGVAIDNITFNEVQPVPEPATMLGLALGAAALARRRSRK